MSSRSDATAAVRYASHAVAFAVGAAFVLLAMSSANADPLSLGTSMVEVTSNVSGPSPTTNSPAPVTVSSVPPSASSSDSLLDTSASVTALPGVSIQANVSDPGLASLVGGQGSIAFLTYYFEVTGGVSTDSVTVDIATILSATSSSSPFYGFSSISVLVPGTVTSLASETVCTSQCSNSGSNITFDGILSVVLHPDSPTEISFEVEALAIHFLRENASASADPFIFIDSSNPNAGDYGIVVSANVGNAALTPLPAALPLFAAGLGVLGLVARRRNVRPQLSKPPE